jgi:glutamyl-tRNA reductase
MAVAVFGLNHASVDLDTLEKLSFSPEDVTTSLSQLSREPDVGECIILSTCNRLEFYAVFEKDGMGRQILYDFLKHAKPAAMDAIGDSFYYKEDQNAIEHLFSVVSGLDSLVVGENEISGQVKKAYKVACDYGTNGVMTNKLFHAAFRTSKRVKNETRINEGNCSVGCVAVDMAEASFPDLQQCRVLLIGAGDIGRVVAKTFAARQVKDLIIANRSLHKAEQLASEAGGTAIPLEQVDTYLDQVDIIVSGTGSPEYLLDYDDMAEWRQHHPSRHIMLVDIALPRDFDPKIGDLSNVLLKNLYDLREIVDANVKKRQDEVPKVRTIVQNEVQKFLNWKEALKINGTIKTLNLSFDAIRNQELERYHHQFPEEALLQVEAFTKSLTKKYVHLIISNIKTLSEVCDLDERQMHILEHLFDSHGVTDEKATGCRYARQHPGTQANPDGK